MATTCAAIDRVCLGEGSNCRQHGAWLANHLRDLQIGVYRTHPSQSKSRPIRRVCGW